MAPWKSVLSPVRVASSPDEFLAACEAAVASDDPQLRRRRSEAMAGESWEAKVAELGRRVEAAEGRRRERDQDQRPGGPAEGSTAAQATA